MRNDIGKTGNPKVLQTFKFGFLGRAVWLLCTWNGLYMRTPPSLTEQIALRGDSMEIVRERGKFLASSPKAL